VFNSRRIAIFFIILAACAGGLKATLDYRVRVEMDNFKKSVSHQMLVKYKEAKSTFLGQAIVTDVKLMPNKSAPIFIDKIILEKAYLYYDPNTLPEQIQMTIKGIRIPIQESPSPLPMLMFAFGYSQYYLSPSELQDLGYENFETDLNLQAELKNNMLKATAVLNGQKWGNLEILLDLQNVINTTQLNRAIAEAQLRNLTATYTDSGLVNRLLTYLAQRNAIQLIDFKNELIEKTENDIRLLGLGLDNSIFLNLQQFIQKPTALQINLNPKIPIAIHSIWYASPQQVGFSIDYLNNENIKD